MNYQGYLFDFDYTLANSEKGIVGCFQRTMEKLGYAPRPVDEIRQTIGLPMENATARLIARDVQKDAVEINNFIESYRQDADHSMTANTFFYADTLSTLRTLRASQAKIGIISTKTRHRIEEKFQQDDVLNLIDFIIGREDVAQPKPDPEGIQQAIARLNLPKEQILYTGDSLVDAKTAQNASVSFAAVTTGTTPAEAFQSLPHIRIMHHLRELLQP